jgi:antitoxin component YwqK of YwqJK toxin-antitoxin module
LPSSQPVNLRAQMQSEMGYMKTALLLLGVLAFCGFLFAQADGQDKRVKVTESKDAKKQNTSTEYYKDGLLVRKELVETRKSDGARLAGYTKMYQGGKLVYVEIWGPGSERQRTYYRDGHRLMTEMDKKGDGTAKWIIVYRDDGQAYAVFRSGGPQSTELLGTNALAEFAEGLEQSRGVIEAITNRVHHQPTDQK